MDFDASKRGKVADKDGQIYKVFGKIVPKIEYYFIKEKLAQILIKHFHADSSRVVQGFLQTLADYDLEPLKRTNFTFTIAVDNDEIRKLLAFAEFCNSEDQPADSPYRLELKIGAQLGAGEIKIP